MHWNQSAGKGGVKNESWSVQNPPLLVFQSVYGTMLSTLSHQIPVERCQSSSCCIPFPETCPESRRPGLLPLQCHFTGISLDLTGDGPAATQKHTWFWIIRAVYATMVGSMSFKTDTARVSSVFNPIEIWRQFRLSLHYDFHFLNKHTAKVWKLEKKTCFFVFFMKNNYENTVSIPIGIKNTIFPKPENSIENGHQNTVNWWLDRFETLKMKASGWFRALCETCFLNEWS